MPRSICRGPRTAIPQLAGRRPQRGAENAGRLVSSAKSWLSYSGVDRTAAILPPQLPEGVGKISPVAASRALSRTPARRLEPRSTRTRPLTEQQVLVTVPASFDAVARELTEHAAERGRLQERHPARRAAGRLLRLDRAPSRLARAGPGRRPDPGRRHRRRHHRLHPDRRHRGSEANCALERVAVGEHILLGGDNMDLALARTSNQQLAEKGTKLDALQFNALWQQCRVAKETAARIRPKEASTPSPFSAAAPAWSAAPSRAKLSRADLERVLLDGFFPWSRATTCRSPRRVGLAGNRTALRRRRRHHPAHLAKFLRQSRPHSPTPTHVLFNGGVLRAGHRRATA